MGWKDDMMKLLFTENSRGQKNFMSAPATKEGSFKHVKYLWRDEEANELSASIAWSIVRISSAKI